MCVCVCSYRLKRKKLLCCLFLIARRTTQLIFLYRALTSGYVISRPHDIQTCYFIGGLPILSEKNPPPLGPHRTQYGNAGEFIMT